MTISFDGNSTRYLAGIANSDVSSTAVKNTVQTGFPNILEQRILQNSASNAGSDLGARRIALIPVSSPSQKASEGTQPDLQEKILTVRAYRQQLIASNIANADTPGFQAVDIDVSEAVASTETERLPITTSAPMHLRGTIEDRTPPFQLKYHIPFQSSADGNTVEMDVERKKYAENSLMYQFSLERVGGEIKHIIELFRDLK